MHHFFFLNPKYFYYESNHMNIHHIYLISFQFSFIIKCNTHLAEVNKSVDEKTEIPLVAVKNFTYKQVEPRLRTKDAQQDIPVNLGFAYVDADASKLPAPVVSKIHQLEASYREGDLTVAGLKRKKSNLIREFLHTAGNQHFVYHKKNQWPPYVKQNKNTSSVQDKSNVQQEYSTKDASKPVNSSQQLGSRKLLWSEYSQIYNETNFGKRVLHKLNIKGRNIYKRRNVKKEKVGLYGKGILATYLGSLPWEKQEVFTSVNPKEEAKKHALPLVAQRHLLDMFAESLLHVNRLFNSEYGYQARRVPAHMPHFINKDIMEKLQEK